MIAAEAGKEQVLEEKKRSTREAAWSAVMRALKGGLVKEEIASAELDRRSKALALRIAAGSIKRHITLTNVFKAVCRKKHILEEVIEVFRQAAYQILFMNVESAVAIDTAVRLSRRCGSNAARVVNGLLRGVMELKPGRKEGNPPFEELRRCIFVATDEGGPGYLWFDRRLVREDPKGDLAHTSSLPGFLAWRYYKTLGEAAFWRLADWANSAAMLTVRVNRLKVPDGEAPPGLLPKDAERVNMPELPQGVYILPDATIEELPGVAAGLLVVQDAANMLPVQAAGIEPGMSVLDMCAAPGGKTVQAAEAMQGKGRLVAVEFIPGRAEQLKRNLERAGATNVEIVMGDAKALPAAMEGVFDRVIADVPCTNTGQMARRPEVRLRVTPASIARLVDEQRTIVEAGLRALKPGGRLVYSTCSLEPEENSGVVRSIKGAEILREETTWPVLHEHDGGYFAVMTKRG